MKAQEIIEKIRAEVERRNGYISVTHFVEELLSVLSDLEKEEKLNSQWSEEDNIMVKDIINAIDTNYASSDWHEMVDWLKSLHLKVKSEKPTTAEELDEEINRYLEPIHTTDIQFEPFTQMTKCARHFAQWQREMMMKEAVETWMIEGSMYEPEFIKRKVIIIKEDK